MERSGLGRDAGADVCEASKFLGMSTRRIPIESSPFLGHPLGRVHFRTNNLGLRRDADTQAAKAPGVFRILVLGDSHTDGYVDNSENFTALLEANLNSHLANPGGNFEVLNAGVISYSPVQELLWYEIHGTRLEPNLVLAVFYVGNDVVELLDPRKPSIDTGGEVIPPRGLQSASEAELSDGLRLGILARYLVQAGPIAEPWRRLQLPGHLAEASGYPIDTFARYCISAAAVIGRGCCRQPTPVITRGFSKQASAELELA